MSVHDVYERWADCLNQDLPDSWGFSGWRVPLGSGIVVRALYECSREMTRVHERLRVFASVYGRWADCLNQDLPDS